MQRSETGHSIISMCSKCIRTWIFMEYETEHINDISIPNYVVNLEYLEDAYSLDNYYYCTSLTHSSTFSLRTGIW